MTDYTLLPEKSSFAVHYMRDVTSKPTMRFGLHRLEHLVYEPYSAFDHIQDLVFTCTQRNLVIHIPAHMINAGIPVIDYCILFAQAPVMFIVYNTNCGNFEI